MKRFPGTLSLSPPSPKIGQPNPSKGFQGLHWSHASCPATFENMADVGRFVHDMERKQIGTSRMGCKHQVL